jgi:hypothetical protein
VLQTGAEASELTLCDLAGRFTTRAWPSAAVSSSSYVAVFLVTDGVLADQEAEMGTRGQCVP